MGAGQARVQYDGSNVSACQAMPLVSVPLKCRPVPTFSFEATPTKNRNADLSEFQPAPDTRQPGLSFAGHSGWAVIVTQLDEPGD